MIILFASIALASGLLFTNIYTSIIDARSWGADIPNSIATARQYFKSVNPGNFFRIFSPANQLLGILALVVFWKTAPSIRICLGAALIMYLLAEAMTFGYFYPRNDLMFRSLSPDDSNQLRKIWAEWASVNWVRSAVLLIGICCSFLALHKIYTLVER